MASTKDDPGTTIIKSDRTGRLRYSQRYKDEVLAAFATSGMSGPAFAEHCGLKYQTFASWVAKRRREKDQPRHPGRKQHFVVAELGPASAPAAPVELRVELPGGSTARLATESQAKLLAALIRALA